ncbi:alpha/beta fold hydrolase [Granulosicoccus antarcticus]|uniref:3-oxoadipate enol-lactonase 2 n=1 Tax=Granulosicoccus antarcticus IMCC3135 TaxID=1192854 RepID=A0A2Z2NND4_9GAMM|nr:alpha/beta fold hydrolase [Granulosicoccus antarcticus]ASJ72739.1 3-oxoadipate enol-lactonase 2 [Granulosicoccus antarcticus IMCC3135]
MTTINLHSQVSGLSDGPGLLLSNSLSTTVNMWNPLLPALEKHFKVVRYDTRGHGKSPAPAAPYSFDDLVNDAFAVMDQHGLETASIMGCSLGSMTALGMGLSRPERIERIVCTAARADSPAPFKQSWDDRIAVLDKNDISALWEGSLANWLTPAFREAQPDSVEQLRNDFLLTNPEGFRGCAAALKGLDYLKDLGTMKVPVLFVAGSEDKGAAPQTMQEMADATLDGKFALVPECGHIVAVNNTSGLESAISDFLGLS